jgi:hypothetical protein
MRYFSKNFFNDASPGLLRRGETDYINTSTVVSYTIPIKVPKLLHYDLKMKPFMEAA